MYNSNRCGQQRILISLFEHKTDPVIAGVVVVSASPAGGFDAPGLDAPFACIDTNSSVGESVIRDAVTVIRDAVTALLAAHLL